MSLKPAIASAHPVRQGGRPPLYKVPKLIGPIRWILIIWGALITNYFLGPTSFPFPSPLSILYFFLIVSVLLAGAWLGNGMQLGYGMAREAGLQATMRNWRIPSLPLFFISMVAMVIGLRIVMATGRTLDQALTETGMVRHREYEQTGMKGALANAFGFLSFSWFFIALIFLRFGKGLRDPWNWGRIGFASLGVGALLVLYVVIVSRNAFLVLLLMALFYVAIIEQGLLKVAFKRLGRLGVVAAASVGLVLIGYILFISVTRTAGEKENTQFVNNWMTFKYKLTPLETVDYEVAAGVYKLQWYAAHPLRNLNDILNYNPPIVRKGGASSVFNWPMLQAAKFSPSMMSVVENSTVSYYALTAVLGENAWQWASGLTALINDFGMAGTLVVIFIWGMLIGWTHRDFWANGSLLSAAICMWICIFVAVMPLFFPIDNFIQTNLYAMLGLKGFCLVFGQRNI